MRPLVPLLASILLLAGCGGGSPSASGASPQSGGKAAVRIVWPARSARLIPAAANSVVVSLTQDGLPVASRTIARPAESLASNVVFDGLPYGSLAVTASAFPNADGSGVAQASGAGTMKVAQGVPGTVAVALDSTVARVEIAPVSPPIVGGTVPVTLLAKDRNGSVVLLANGGAEAVAWTSDAPEVATVAGAGPTATLTAVAEGVANLTATLKVKDDGTTVTARTSVTVSVPTIADFVGHWDGTYVTKTGASVTAEGAATVDVATDGNYHAAFGTGTDSGTIQPNGSVTPASALHLTYTPPTRAGGQWHLAGVRVTLFRPPGTSITIVTTTKITVTRPDSGG